MAAEQSPSPSPALPVHEALAHGDVMRWQLRRNCRLTPRQLGGCFGAVCAFHLLLALAFWALGFPVVSLFAGLEVAVLAAALLVYARHACDREIITLAADRLSVEQHVGPRVERLELPAAWVRVHADGPAALVRLSAGSRSVCVGRHLPPAQRALMARALRQALTHAQPPPPGSSAP